LLISNWQVSKLIINRPKTIILIRKSLIELPLTLGA
jgi:hypothetical protein